MTTRVPVRGFGSPCRAPHHSHRQPARSRTRQADVPPVRPDSQPCLIGIGHPPSASSAPSRTRPAARPGRASPGAGRRRPARWTPRRRASAPDRARRAGPARAHLLRRAPRLPGQPRRRDPPRPRRRQHRRAVGREVGRQVALADQLAQVGEVRRDAAAQRLGEQPLRRDGQAVPVERERQPGVGQPAEELNRSTRARRHRPPPPRVRERIPGPAKHEFA